MNWHFNNNKNQKKKANTEHLLFAKYFAYIMSQNLTTAIRGRSDYVLHFKNGKPEA